MLLHHFYALHLGFYKFIWYHLKPERLDHLFIKLVTSRKLKCHRPGEVKQRNFLREVENQTSSARRNANSCRKIPLIFTALDEINTSKIKYRFFSFNSYFIKTSEDKKYIVLETGTMRCDSI